MLSAVGLLAAPAVAQEQLDARIELDGREAKSYDVNDPLDLDADRPLEVRITATNSANEPVLLRSVRLRSRVMGLTFLAYETRVDVELPPAGTGEVAFELDLLDLTSQATGLLPAEVELLDAGRSPVADVALTVDVQGSLTSAYGIFGILVVALTLLAGALAAFRLMTGRLPANRWARALHFAAPGLGVGLVLTIGLSTLRVFAPEPGLWGTLLLVCGVVGFALGYLSPSPSRADVVDLADVDFALASIRAETDEAHGAVPPVDAPSLSTARGQDPPLEPYSWEPDAPESDAPVSDAPESDAPEPDAPQPTGADPEPPAPDPSRETQIGLEPPEAPAREPSRETVIRLEPPVAPAPEPSRPTVPGLEPPTEDDR